MSGSVSSRIQYRGAVGELDIECVQIDHDDAMANLIHKRLHKDIAIVTTETCAPECSQW